MASTFDADRDQAPTPSDTPTPEALTTEPARIVGPTDSGGRPLPPASAPPGPPPVGAASPLSDTGDADVEDRPPVRPNRPEADDDLHDGEHEDAEQQVGGEDHEPSGHEDSPEPPGAHDQPASAEVEAPAQEVEEPGREPEEHGDGHSQSEDDVSQEDPELSGSRPDEDVGDRPESTTELEDPDHGDGDAQRPGHEEESEED